MKNVLKKIALIMLAVSMTVPAASALGIPEATVAEAASQNMTLYVGEKYDITSANSVKSNKKNIVKTGTDKSSGYVQHYMIAKKAGKAVVTVKSKYGNTTTKYNVTVKKNPVKASLSMTGYKNPEVLITLKNSSSQIFETATVKYTLKKSDGSVFEEKEVTVYNILGKKSAYKTISLSSSADFDLSVSDVKVTGVYHNPNRKYVDASSKVKVSAEDTTAAKEVESSLTVKNSVGKSVSGNVYYLLKNSSDEIIGVTSYSQYLQKKATETNTHSIYVDMYPGYDHYDMVGTFYYTK